MPSKTATVPRVEQSALSGARRLAPAAEDWRDIDRALLRDRTRAAVVRQFAFCRAVECGDRLAVEQFARLFRATIDRYYGLVGVAYEGNSQGKQAWRIDCLQWFVAGITPTFESDGEETRRLPLANFDRSRGTLSAFVATCIFHKAVDIKRRAAASRRKNINASQDPTVTELIWRADGETLAEGVTNTTPFDEAWGNQLRWIMANVLPDLIEALPARQKIILELSLQGLSNSEIAGLLGCGLSNVNGRLEDARTSLKKALTRLGYFVKGHEDDR